MKDGLLGKLSEEQAESLESIRNSSLQLNSLIEKLLTFTVVTAKGPGISKEPVNINTHVSSMAEPYVKSLAGNKKNTVRITCSDEKLTTKISPSSLDTMLKNILENSVKFNDKDAIDIEINIEQDGDRSRIIVSDNGRGIAPEERVKIFDKFYQIEKFFTGNIDGAGLGLALIKHLINAYGGQIKMDSELGKGTRLSFSLPE